MSKLPILDNLSVASPCDADWAQMSGDDQVRFCGDCEKNVYDLTTLAPEEVVELIEKTEGNLCGRLYQRPDGRVLHGDCPVGVARMWRKARRRAHLSAAWALSLAASAFALIFYGDAASEAVFGKQKPVTRVIEIIDQTTPPEPPPPEPMMGALAVDPIEMGEIELAPEPAPPVE